MKLKHSRSRSVFFNDCTLVLDHWKSPDNREFIAISTLKIVASATSNKASLQPVLVNLEEVDSSAGALTRQKLDEVVKKHGVEEPLSIDYVSDRASSILLAMEGQHHCPCFNHRLNNFFARAMKIEPLKSTVEFGNRLVEHDKRTDINKSLKSIKGNILAIRIIAYHFEVDIVIQRKILYLMIPIFTIFR